MTEAAQIAITQLLAELDADIPVIGEESGEEENTRALRNSRKWIVDPIDGTTNYSRGSDRWGTTVAYIENGEVQAGAIYLPDCELLYAAEAGRGCFCNEKPLILTPSEKPLKESVVGMEWGFWLDEERANKQVRVTQEARGTTGLLSAVYGIAELLRGRSDAYLNLHMPTKGASIWDFAAGHILLREALAAHPNQQVGWSPSGEPLSWDAIKMEALFATGPILAQEILRLIQE